MKSSIMFAAGVLSLAAAMGSLLNPSASAQSRGDRRPGASSDQGGIAGAGIPLLSTVRVASPASSLVNPLTRPIFATFAPGDPTRLFIVEKKGYIRILKIDVNPPVLLDTDFLDIDAVCANGASQANEQGLLGLAFHPNYQDPNNRYFYVYYTGGPDAGPWTNVVARYRRSAGNPDLAEGSGTGGSVVLQLADGESNHNGGWIGFKPGETNGNLYVAVGDGGGACDLHGSGNAQNINTLFGKILRVDVDGADNVPANGDDDTVADALRNYSIPAGNPFAATAGEDEIWAYGLRNPSRNSFDRATGDLYVADVGQGAWEEVNYELSSSPGGRNYGWRCMEGLVASSVSGCDTSGCPAASCAGSMTCPIHVYANDATTCAISGGYVYRGTRIPQLQGTYFFGDYHCSIGGGAPIWSFRVVGGAVTNLQLRTAELAPGAGQLIETLTSFGEDYFGEIYICDQEGGEIFKIIPRPCTGDIIPNLVRDTDDLLQIIGSWGTCAAPCPADIQPSGVVDTDDLVLLIGNWGLCPSN